MIKFFRQIRKRLLGEGKTATYFKYALGEIFLVMIGILLALQVNSWNQNRLNRIEEKQLLSNLHNEFIENQRLVKELLNTLTNAKKANEIITSLMGASKENILQYNLDSIFYESLPAYQFTSSEQSIKNILEGGKMNIIKNNDIIKSLYLWEAQKKTLELREKSTDHWINNYVLLYLNKHISFKEMDNYGHFSWTGKSKLKKDYSYIFQSLEFENIIDNSLYMNEIYLKELKKSDSLAGSIINLTKGRNSD